MKRNSCHTAVVLGRVRLALWVAMKLVIEGRCRFCLFTGLNRKTFAGGSDWGKFIASEKTNRKDKACGGQIEYASMKRWAHRESAFDVIAELE